jgi:hypothetical protein
MNIALKKETFYFLGRRKGKVFISFGVSCFLLPFLDV